LKLHLFVKVDEVAFEEGFGFIELGDPLSVLLVLASPFKSQSLLGQFTHQGIRNILRLVQVILIVVVLLEMLDGVIVSVPDVLNFLHGVPVHDPLQDVFGPLVVFTLEEQGVVLAERLVGSNGLVQVVFEVNGPPLVPTPGPFLVSDSHRGLVGLEVVLEVAGKRFIHLHALAESPPSGPSQVALGPLWGDALVLHRERLSGDHEVPEPVEQRHWQELLLRDLSFQVHLLCGGSVLERVPLPQVGILVYPRKVLFLLLFLLFDLFLLE